MKKNWFYQIIDELTMEFRKAGFTTVSFGESVEIDFDKQSAFPLAHIILPTAEMEEKETSFIFQILVIDLVDFSKLDNEVYNSTFDTNNVQDVLQDLLARVQRCFKFVDDNDYITMEYPLTMDSFKENFTNAVAGWTISVTFKTPNLADTCEN